MEVTGYLLREHLKQWNLRKSTAEGEFAPSLYKFKDETKESPSSIANRLSQSEAAIITLQVAQMQYNLGVQLDVPGIGRMSLAQAIKALGAAERGEKLWRGVSVTPVSSMYRVRDSNQEAAEATIDTNFVLQQTSLASKRVGVLKAAIATANATKFAINDLSPSLFE